MASKLSLTLTCGDYEITRPLAEGLVAPDGIALTVLTDPASRDRHWRLARNAECDLGEFNACAYFMARERGHPYVALPIYPHRRFRHGFIFINTQKGISQAADLRGRRIGCFGGFQPAACVWLRGILEEFFALPHGDGARGLVVVPRGDDALWIRHDCAVVQKDVDVILGAHERANVAVHHKVGILAALDGFANRGVNAMDQLAHLAADALLPLRQPCDIGVDARVRRIRHVSTLLPWRRAR